MPIKVHSYDVDYMRIVNNTVYVKWFEDLRMAMLDKCFSSDGNDEGEQYADPCRDPCQVPTLCNTRFQAYRSRLAIGTWRQQMGGTVRNCGRRCHLLYRLTGGLEK